MRVNQKVSRNEGMTVSEVTRRNIIDYLRSSSVLYYGRMNEIEFLSRLYDIEKLPSRDYRFSTAKGDIGMHRYNFSDWPNDWIFTDERFNLLRGPDELFLQFLCEMLHPLVRSNPREVKKLLTFFNDQLDADGWELFEQMRISRKPVFAARRKVAPAETVTRQVKEVASTMDAEYLTKQITRMETAIESDPELAIGTAKELIETCCRTILSERGKPVIGKPDIPALTKTTFRELNLVPEGIKESAKGNEVIKRMLSNLASISQCVTEIRGLYGTGHGKDAKTQSLDPRHAKLIVGAATTLVTFLFETHTQEE